MCRVHHTLKENNTAFKVTGQRKNHCVQKLIVVLLIADDRTETLWTELQTTAKTTSCCFEFCVENMFCYDIEII